MTAGIKRFKPGEVIMKEGSGGTSAYVITSGQVDVLKRVKGKDVLIAVLRKGQVFGEMALIEDRPRSATIVATTPLEVKEISREAFNDLLNKDPLVLIPIIKSLFEKLRQTSSMLAQRVKGTHREIEPGTKEFRVVLSGLTAHAKEALDDREMVVNKYPFLIGRYSANVALDVFYINDLSLKEAQPYRVSRNHLAIIKEDGGIWLVDRGSAYGSIVNGETIGGKSAKTCIRLNDNENRVTVGDTISKFTFLIKIVPEE